MTAIAVPREKIPWCRDLCPQKAIAFPDLEAIAGLIRELHRESGGGS